MAVVVNVVGQTNMRDLAKAEKALAGLRQATEQQSSRMGKALGGAGRKIAGFTKQLAKVGAVAGAAMATGAVAVGKHVFEVGAQLEDLDKKAAAVFEGQLPDMQKWARANAGAMGLTSTELLGLTANFADLLKPMGFSAEQAAEMAGQTNELAGALAKWSGGQKSAAEVSDVLAKAMLGEREGLKALGISISEADVAQRLAANGSDKLTGAALEQAKAIATQQLIMEKSTDAQEAWAEGQDDLSVKINKAKAFIGELKEKAIRTLLPVVIDVTERMAKWGQRIARDLQPKIEALGQWWQRNSPAILGTAQRLGAGLRRVFDRIAGAIQTVIGWFQANRDEAGAATEGILAKFRPIWEQIVGVVSSAVEAIRTVVTTVLTVVQGFWDRFGKHLVDFMGRQLGRIIEVVRGAFEILKGIFDVVTSVLQGDWSGAWEAIKSTLRGALRIVTNAISGAFDAIKTLFGAGVAAISQVWSFLWEQIRGALGAAWDGIKDAVRSGLDWIGERFDDLVSFVTGLPGKIAQAAQGMWDGITDAFRDAINWIIRGWNRIEFRIPGFKVGPIGYDGFTLGLPDIPTLAQGGIATEPTLALIGEGRQDEAVIPLPSDWRRGGGPGGSVTINTLQITVNVPAGTRDPQDIARIARNEVEGALSRVVRGLAAGAGSA